MTRLSIVAITASAALLLFIASQIARAQSQQDWREANTKQTLTLNQTYHGTTPGSGNSLPRVEELKSLKGSWVTWPGFYMLPDGGSRIFIQTTKPLDFIKTEKKSKLSLTFIDTNIFLPNNQNPLVTTYFNTPIKKSSLKVTNKKKKKVELIINLKVKSKCTVSQTSDQDGYHYIFIDFPSGQYPAGNQLTQLRQD